MLKELLKKLRWKWHRDLSEQMCEQHSLMQRSLRERNISSLEDIILDLQKQRQQIMDRQSSLEMAVAEIRQTLSQISAAQSTLEVQGQNWAGLDSFTKRVESEKVFSLLQDRESQKLFWARLCYSQNGDLVPLMRHLMQADRSGDRRDIISMLRDRLNGVDPDEEIIIFGTTFLTKELFLTVRALGIKVNYICKGDNYEWYTANHLPPLLDYDWLGVPVISEKTLLSEHSNAQILIGDCFDFRAEASLIQKGIPAERLWIRATLWENQYLDPDIMKPCEHEVYVDGGVLYLDSTIEFIDWCGGNYDAVYAFEPDVGSYMECVKKIQDLPQLDEERVHLMNVALSDKNEELKFMDGCQGGSSLDERGTSIVSGRTLDSVLNGQRVTFIKLDIEGAEMAALIGATVTIKRWKPRLAICIYHRPEDPIDIPLYIHGIVPEYKMYIRHYSTCEYETVLYCVCDTY